MGVDVKQVVKDFNRMMQPAVKASANVKRDLETHIRQFEVPFNLEPLARALKEQKSNETARYNDARAAASFYNTTEGLQVADADFTSQNIDYTLKAILRYDNHLYLHVGIIDQETELPGSLDLSGKARIVIADPNGSNIVSAPINSVNGAQFDFAALRPADYVAKMHPPEPKQ